MQKKSIDDNKDKEVIPIEEFKYLLVMPILSLFLTPTFGELGVKEAGVLSIVLLIISILCSLVLIDAMDIKEDEIKENKTTFLTVFAVFILCMGTYFGILYFNRSSIVDFGTVYTKAGIVVVQTAIFMFFLSNLFPPSKDLDEPVNEDIT